MYSWKAEAKLFYVETGEVNKKGKPVKIPVTIKTLWLTWNESPFLPKKYKVVRTKRRGEISYSVSYLKEPKKDLWRMPKLQPDPLPTWAREGSLNEMAFKDWLRKRVQNPLGAFLELETVMPEKAAA